MYGRIDVGSTSTTTTHQALATIVAAPRAMRSPIRRFHLPGAATRIARANAGSTRYACRNFALKASPTTSPATTSHRRRPVWNE